MKFWRIALAVVLILSAAFSFYSYYNEDNSINDTTPPADNNSGIFGDNGNNDQDDNYGKDYDNNYDNDYGNPFVGDGNSDEVQDNNGNTDNEFASHIYLECKNIGDCRELKGKIAVLTVFVDEDNITWSQSDMQTVKNNQRSEMAELKSEAGRYGVSFDTELLYYNAKMARVLDTDKSDLWKDDVIATTGFENYSTAYNWALKTTGADECVIAFYFNRDGRAFAYQIESGWGNEFMILFAVDSNAFAHELTHVFGSKDLYFPDKVEESAKRIFGESIMLDSSVRKVDSLTAYLIGWTDVLSDEAKTFLRESAYLTKQDLNAEYEIENYTGYVTNKEFDNGIYTGNLTDGFFDGKGRMRFDTGDIYDGEWSFGIKNGKGTYIWADGNTYTGDWVRDSMTGKGEMKYADGTVYSGDWVDGALTGNGTIKYADGSQYTGEFLNGQFQGFGTMHYTDGGWYSGEWQNSSRHGKGTLTWNNGDKYTGDFNNNVITGSGTLVYATGDVYVGAFLNGLMSGYGEYKWANGDLYKGQWAENAMNGQGTLTFTDGTVYRGTFSNGDFLG